VEHVSWASDLAKQLLSEALPRRWAHSEGVGRKAESVAYLVGDDALALVCAAWLHDIGYAPNLTATGFHALDGARYLRDTVKAGSLICRLVANHSCAINEAKRRGLADALGAEFPAVDGLLTDAMIYCDMTTSPDGDSVDVETRLREIAARYEPGSVVAESIAESAPQIIQSVRTITGDSAFRPR
jgi:predicted hydrolase (HD superfamily)